MNWTNTITKKGYNSWSLLLSGTSPEQQKWFPGINLQNGILLVPESHFRYLGADKFWVIIYSQTSIIKFLTSPREQFQISGTRQILGDYLVPDLQ